jgi:hypothetical protein
LFVQKAKTFVIAGSADAIFKQWGILELAERGGERMFERMCFVWTIETDAHLQAPLLYTTAQREDVPLRLTGANKARKILFCKGVASNETDCGPRHQRGGGHGWMERVGTWMN